MFSTRLSALPCDLVGWHNRWFGNLKILLWPLIFLGIFAQTLRHLGRSDIWIALLLSELTKPVRSNSRLQLQLSVTILLQHVPMILGDTGNAGDWIACKWSPLILSCAMVAWSVDWNIQFFDVHGREGAEGKASTVPSVVIEQTSFPFIVFRIFHATFAP